MGSREDDDHWNNKYAEEPSCDEHGEDEMYYDHAEAEYYCLQCQREDEITRTYHYG